MQAKEWTFIEKKHWGPGPWARESDKYQFMDEATGLPCLIVRNELGALCGYVGVSEGHPAYQKDWDSVEAEVHGGLTFADTCQPDAEHDICHVVEEGEDDKVWWLGFDTAHAGDYVPGYPVSVSKIFRDRGDRYRDVEYVRGQCRNLAAQLAEMK